MSAALLTFPSRAMIGPVLSCAGGTILDFVWPSWMKFGPLIGRERSPILYATGKFKVYMTDIFYLLD